MSCPFFGLALIGNTAPPWPIESNGNQCALITAAHSPCRMSIEAQEPNWKECPRNPANNGTGPPNPLQAPLSRRERDAIRRKITAEETLDE
jgi:hypothetical protein